jgi:hypothetical protein
VLRVPSAMSWPKISPLGPLGIQVLPLDYIAGKENQASLLSFPRQAKVEVMGPIRVGLGAGLGLLITQSRSRWWANLERPARHYHIWDIRGLVWSAISFS